MAMGTASAAEFDPRSPRFLRDPQAVLLPLLEETPVFYHEPGDAYYVLPYDEVRSIFTDDRYSSHVSKGIPVRADLRHRIPEAWERAGQVIQGGQVSNLDAPAHTPQRRAMQHAFTHKQVGRTKPQIAAIADQLIDGFIDRGSCDLMQEFATELTVRVVGQMMELPTELLENFHAWVADVLGILAPIDARPEDVAIPDDQLVAIFERVYPAYTTYSEFIEQRRANPGTDLCSAMLTVTERAGSRCSRTMTCSPTWSGSPQRGPTRPRTSSSSWSATSPSVRTSSSSS